jgi:hypothetical protein
VAYDVLGALSELARILEDLGLRYAVGGSLASGAWGEPRSTHDVDLIVELPETHVAELFRALEPSFYVDQAAMREAVRRSRAFNVIHLGRHVKIDLFVAGRGALDVAQLESPIPRRLSVDSDRDFPVTAPELVVLRKLDWYRAGGGVSDRQWRDVLAVLRVQGSRLDRARMRALATETGLSELLERAIAEAWGPDAD